MKDRASRPRISSTRQRNAGNLPAPLMQLVGRETAIRGVGKVLLESRLVTLMGPGGVGKTALAIEVASQTTRGADGKWFADLAAVVDDASVEHAVVTTFDLPEVGQASPFDVVAGYVRDRDALLVMDNCEHVLDGAAALITNLLRSSPRLTVLATSRAPLHTEGEVLFVVKPLDLPERDGDYPATASAFRLFVERAGAFEPEFAVNEENTEAVTHICRKLEGLPLAIELAASRCSVISPAEIAEGLDQGLAILGRGRRDASPRHQAIDASIAWSWELLDDAAKTLLRRVSVLPAPFAKDAAETVSALDHETVIDALSALVDGSLMQVMTGTVDVRYRVLEPIRQFAHERLREAGEIGSCERRLVGWCSSLADRFRTNQHGTTGAVAIAALEDAMPHLRRALDTCASERLIGEGIRIIVSSMYLWERRHIVEGITRLRGLLGSAEPGSKDESTGGWALADFSYFVGDLDASRKWAEKALAVASACGDRLAAGRAHNMLGWCHFAAQNPAAEDDFRLAVIESDASEDDDTAIRARRGLATLALASGHPNEALSFCEQALTLTRAGGSPLELEWALFYAAMAAYDRGELEVAESFLNEGTTLGEAIGDELVLPLLNALLSRVEARRGLLEQAIDRAEAFVERCRERQMMISMAGVLWALSLTKYEQSAPGTDIPELEQAQLLLTLVGMPHLAAPTAAARVDAAVNAGDVERGVAIAQEGLSLTGQPFGAAGRGVCQLALAKTYEAKGDDGAALRTIQDALASLLSAGDRIGAIRGLEQAAKLMTNRAAEDAARLIGAADAGRELLGCPAPPVAVPGIEECRHALSEVLGLRYDTLVAEGAGLTVEKAAQRVRRGRGRRGRPSAGWDSLTPSERSVVGLVAQGLTNAAIAKHLVISVSTVKSHVGHIFDKLGVANRSELVVVAGRQRDATQPH